MKDAADREDRGDSFFARWSRRKTQARGAEPAPQPSLRSEPPAAAPPAADPAALQPPAPAAAATNAQTPEAAVAPAPTLADVADLTADSDYSRFVARGVDPTVQRAALKRLFADPHFNVMDGLDTYIDDYGKPDPLPPGMLRKMVQSQLLGLFKDEAEAAAETCTATTLTPALSREREGEKDAEGAAAAAQTDDEDTDLQLQPDDGARRADAGADPGPDAGRER